MKIPGPIWKSVEKAGGLRGLSKGIPRAERIDHVSAVFQSLSDPARLSILYALAATPLCVCVIKSMVKISDSKLSYHLDKLKSTGLVSRIREGKFVIYRITKLGRALLSSCKDVG